MAADGLPEKPSRLFCTARSTLRESRRPISCLGQLLQTRPESFRDARHSVRFRNRRRVNTDSAAWSARGARERGKTAAPSLWILSIYAPIRAPGAGLAYDWGHERGDAMACCLEVSERIRRSASIRNGRPCGTSGRWRSCDGRPTGDDGAISRPSSVRAIIHPRTTGTTRTRCSYRSIVSAGWLALQLL
jgi:hypothetical protein